MRFPDLTLDGAPPPSAALADGDADVARLRALVDEHYDFIWRSLRRLGVGSGDVDDGVQAVFLTASRRMADIRPGCERSFLFQTAVRVAADSRRTVRRRRETPAEAAPPPVVPPEAEELVDLRRAWARLDGILDGMAIDLRAVFVLFEIDEMTIDAIAGFLDLRPGTVASRLRRARADFRARLAREKARLASKGSPR